MNQHAVTVARTVSMALVICALLFTIVRVLELNQPPELSDPDAVVVVGVNCGARAIRVYGPDDLGAAASECQVAERHNVPA